MTGPQELPYLTEFVTHWVVMIGQLGCQATQALTCQNSHILPDTCIRNFLVLGVTAFSACPPAWA